MEESKKKNRVNGNALKLTETLLFSDTVLDILHILLPSIPFNNPLLGVNSLDLI